MRRVLLLGLLVAGGASCREHEPAPTAATLGGELVARAGDEAVPAAVVEAVARAQSLDADAALERLVSDATAAARARQLGLDTSHRRRVSAALARTVVDRVRAEAAAADPTDADVDELTRLHWRELDASESLRVVHAVVLRPAKPTDPSPAAARALAERLVREVGTEGSPDDFEARARTVTAPGLTVRVERLPSFVDDGRMVEGDGGLDADFVRGAFALRTPGQTSGLVETTFGWHVIRLVERMPARRPPLDERRRLLRDEVRARRASTALRALLERRRAGVGVDRATGLDAILGELDRAPAP